MTQENQFFATEGLTAVWIIKIGKAHSFDKRKQWLSNSFIVQRYLTDKIRHSVLINTDTVSIIKIKKYTVIEQLSDEELCYFTDYTFQNKIIV